LLLTCLGRNAQLVAIDASNVFINTNVGRSLSDVFSSLIGKHLTRMRDNFLLGHPKLSSNILWMEQDGPFILVNCSDPIAPAILEWVAEISPSDFHLIPCGG
jgi:hypothetical protein